MKFLAFTLLTISLSAFAQEENNNNKELSVSSVGTIGGTGMVIVGVDERKNNLVRELKEKSYIMSPDKDAKGVVLSRTEIDNIMNESVKYPKVAIDYRIETKTEYQSMLTKNKKSFEITRDAAKERLAKLDLNNKADRAKAKPIYKTLEYTNERIRDLEIQISTLQGMSPSTFEQNYKEIIKQDKLRFTTHYDLTYPGQAQKMDEFLKTLSKNNNRVVSVQRFGYFRDLAKRNTTLAGLGAVVAIPSAANTVKVLYQNYIGDDDKTSGKAFTTATQNNQNSSSQGENR